MNMLMFIIAYSPKIQVRTAFKNITVLYNMYYGNVEKQIFLTI